MIHSFQYKTKQGRLITIETTSEGEVYLICPYRDMKLTPDDAMTLVLGLESILEVLANEGEEKDELSVQGV